MADPNLPMLEDAVRKLAPFLEEIVFVGGATLGLLITDEAAAPIRGTTDIDVIAEIVTYADYIAFSERNLDLSMSSRDLFWITRESLSFKNDLCQLQPVLPAAVEMPDASSADFFDRSAKDQPSERTIFPSSFL
jgi:hypothetical protein